MNATRLRCCVEQMPHGERGARGVVEIHRAHAGRPQVDQHERALHRHQRGQRFRLDETGNRHRVGRMQAHLLDHVFGGAGGQHGRHDAALAAGVFHAVQHVRKERADGEIVVLTVQQKRETADARAQLGGVIAELARRFDDALAGGLGKARLVLQCARDGADRHAGRAGDVADGCGHRMKRTRKGGRTVFGFGRLYSKTVLKPPEKHSLDTRKYP